MPVDSVSGILAGSGIRYSNLSSKNPNEICALLNVDAVIAGEVEFSDGRKIFLPAASGIEKARVWLHIYDKNFKKPIWTFKEQITSKKYNEYYRPSNYINGSNEEYLIAYMFDKAMKLLPYVIKSPIKRY
jgi:hypothetical protein